MQPGGEHSPYRRKASPVGASEPASKRPCTSSSQPGVSAGTREGRGASTASHGLHDPTFEEQGGRSEQGSPLQPATPDIRSTLASLGLSAKEVFACGELQLLAGIEQALGPDLEPKLADLLQQLWCWAVRKGKVSPNEPVTELQLTSVAQWGLQRMCAGAVQAANSQAETVEDSSRCSSDFSSCGLGAADLQNAAEAAEWQAALLAREEAAARCVQTAAAQQQGEGLLVSCWLNLLRLAGQGGAVQKALPPPQQQEQQQQQGRSSTLAEPQPSGPAFPAPQLLRRTSSGPPFSSPKPALSLPPLPPKPSRPSRPSTAVRHATSSAQQLGKAGWVLGELSAAELREHPAFTVTLKEVVAGFNLCLAAHGITFNYTPAHLRQACTFVVRNLLTTSQKQTLARDREGLFQVLLQACGLIQHMESSLLKLQLSVDRKCGRIASAADQLVGGAGPGRVASGFGGSGKLG